ncbi:hypothetical protein GF358_02350 [Candidatus Woesearchaeota archaeon]|nr:hypothetical protein [Candidatus Woesearchaeota archaeon]
MKKKKKRKTKKHKKKEASKEPLFIGVRDPVFVRRSILLSSKDLIDSLKKFEGLVDLRLRKENYVVEFKRVVDELLVLNRKLRSHLPKTQLREKEVPVKTKVEPKPLPSHKSHLDLLEEELSKVEAKLDALD